MKFWLLKSEPDVFGYPDLARVGVEHWNGVRNYQARNFLRQMEVGDLCLIYHSNARPPGVAGVGRVVKAAHPDNLEFDVSSPYFDARSRPGEPRWSMVDIAAVVALPNYLPLDTLRQRSELGGLRLLQKGTRLSVMPVGEAEFRCILKAGGLNDSYGSFA
ncbi:EVE domain-containing protein [Deinococcus sp.]|uniref:EVE domain-containing protein n=1 Tax=Deinococcus sp. TaxID=47478 RepID=UPI0025CF10A2|nr:EVE domain-containing protein [Deinococcus sp.]